MDRSIMKPVLAGCVAGGMQKYLFPDDDMNKIIMFGGSVAVGQYASNYIVPMVQMLPHLPSISESLYDGKTLAVRITEVGSTAGVGYLINRFLLNNDEFSDELMSRVAIIAVSDVISEYVVDYLDGKQLSYLTKE